MTSRNWTTLAVVGIVLALGAGLVVGRYWGSAEAAESALPKGSPDWLRAQDIAMQARAAIEQTRKRR